MNAYITLHPKDASTLRYCVDGIMQCPGIARVYAISGRWARGLCHRLAVSWVDEDSVVPGVAHASFREPRWGWYFQQILKLGVAWVEREDCYLVVDADTVFVRPVRFFSEDGRTCFATASEHHEPYFETFERMLRCKPCNTMSFIAHHMVFHCARVREMCSAFGPDPLWWRNIAACLEPRAPHFSRSQFSEYETYGNYVAARYPDRILIRPLRWRNLDVRPSRRQVRRFAGEYDFVSFQEYLRTERRLSRPWRVMLSRIKHRALEQWRRLDASRGAPGGVNV
jgi:hypothetical protein